MNVGQTFLTHVLNNCGGAIAIDPSKVIKLVAPSFRVGMNGLHGLTLDARIADGGKCIPEFQCIKCGEMVDKSHIKEEASAICQVCGKTKPIGELYVHKDVPSICESCCTEIKESVKTGKYNLVRIREYIENFGVTQRNFKVAPMIEVLYSPITI